MLTIKYFAVNTRADNIMYSWRSLVVYVEQVGAADAQHVLHGPGALVDGHDGKVAAQQAVGLGPHAHGQSLEHHLGRTGLGLHVVGRVQARGPDGGQRRPAAGQRHGDGQRGGGGGGTHRDAVGSFLSGHVDGTTHTRRTGRRSMG